jgi:hypothetical protein
VQRFLCRWWRSPGAIHLLNGLYDAKLGGTYPSDAGTQAGWRPNRAADEAAEQAACSWSWVLNEQALANSAAGVVVLAVRAVPGRHQRAVDEYFAVDEHAGQLGLVQAGDLVERHDRLVEPRYGPLTDAVQVRENRLPHVLA